jgi:hypothetical protein
MPFGFPGSPSFGGTSRQTTHQWDTGDIVVAHIKTNAVHVPTTPGGEMFNYSYNAVGYNLPPGRTAAYAPLIVQANTYYRGPFIDNTNPGQNGNWVSFNVGGLLPSNFVKLSGPGPQFPTFCPGRDNQMKLGYVTINRNVNGPNAISSVIDDWTVEFQPTPLSLDPDFTLIATLRAGATTFTMRAMSAPLPPAAGFYWDVAEITPAGVVLSNVPNPSPWWANPIVNDFQGYASSGSLTNSPTSPGVFKAGHTYRVKRGVWDSCTPWAEVTKKVFMCTNC